MALLSKHTVLHKPVNTQWYLSHTQVFVCVPVLSCPFILRNANSSKIPLRSCGVSPSHQLTPVCNRTQSVCFRGRKKSISQGCRKSDLRRNFHLKSFISCHWNSFETPRKILNWNDNDKKESIILNLNQIKIKTK